MMLPRSHCFMVIHRRTRRESEFLDPRLYCTMNTMKKVYARNRPVAPLMISGASNKWK